MPRSVLHTYSKKRAPNDCSNMAFDKLIQDVSNNTIKKQKLSIPIINENSDENVYNMFDEPNLIVTKQSTTKTTKNEVIKQTSFFKSKKGNKKIMEEQKQQQVENKRKSNRSKKSKINLKNEESDIEDNILTVQSSSSSSIVKSNSHSSVNRGQSLLDLGQLAKTVKLEEIKPKQQFFTSKSKSLDDNVQKSKTTNTKDSESDDDSKEFEKLITAKFRLTKSHSDTSSPNSSLNSSSFNDKESPKTSAPKRIFSSNQTKKNQIKFNYNLFNYNDTTVTKLDDDINDELNKNIIEIENNNEDKKVNSRLRPTTSNLKKSSDDYAVLLNTRKAYECEELGETQSYTDDTNYLMEGLNDNFQLANRCMSALKLAEYCLNSEFRMHLRSQGIFTKIFNLLHDSAKDYSLALCTSCLMYTLSRDKLVMDIDKPSLKLMINILNTNIPTPKQQAENLLYKKIYQQCKDLLIKLEEQYNHENHAENTETIVYSLKFDFDNFNSNLVAIECLLSLTNRRIGDWYKEELRVLGAFEHILNIIDKCVADINSFEDKNIFNNLIAKYIRCFKLLENVTHANQENQNFVCLYKNSVLITIIKNSLNIFMKKLMLNSIDNKDKKTVSEATKITFLFMINLTHNNELGCNKIANNNELINSLFLCIHSLIDHISENERFDVLIMALGVILNLFHLNKQYQKKFIKKIPLTNGQSISSLDIIIKLFNQKQSDVNEAETDQEKEWSKLNQEIETQNVENINCTVMNSIHKAGKHMEDHIVAAHLAVIIGYVLLVDQSQAETIKSKLNNHKFIDLIEIMKKFLLFMKIMKVSGFSADDHIKDILRVLEDLSKNEDR